MLTDDSLITLDDALVRLRRLWSAGRTVVVQDDGAPLEMSSVLVVEACARRTERGIDTTIGDVARFADIEHSTASRLVDRAARSGLVTREAAAGDARRTVVVLTELGRDTRARALHFRMSWLRAVLASWTGADVAAFATLLERFAGDVDVIGPPHAPTAADGP